MSKARNNTSISSLIVILVFLCFDGLAQRKCGYSEILRDLKGISLENHKSQIKYRLDEFSSPDRLVKTVVIPTVVHIMHNPNDAYGIGSNISREQILSQIEAINNDFGRINEDSSQTFPYFLKDAAASNIRLCLAGKDPFGNPSSGVTRFSYSKSVGHHIIRDDLSMKNLRRWDTRKYLNIWVVASISSGILAYSPTPDLISDSTYSLLQDGIVASSTYVGSSRYASTDSLETLKEGYQLGRTLTHELGHFFNLKHIWGDGDCTMDDEVGDTPLCSGLYFSCEGKGPIQCNAERMIQNYMDYSLDECMNIFTKGQVEVMDNALDFFDFRKSMYVDSNLFITGCSKEIPYFLKLLTDDELTICVNESPSNIQLKVLSANQTPLHEALVFMEMEKNFSGVAKRVFARTNLKGEVEFMLPAFTKSGYYELHFFASIRGSGSQSVKVLVVEGADSEDLIIVNNPSAKGNIRYRIHSKGSREFRLALTNSIGQEILNREIRSNGWQEGFINMIGRSNGIYYLSLISAKGIITKKMVLVNGKI